MTDNSMTRHSGLGQFGSLSNQINLRKSPGMIVIVKSGGFDNATAIASGSGASGGRAGLPDVVRGATGE